MPIPLIPLAIVGVSLLAGAIAVPAVVRKIRNALRGKSVAILGPQKVGKTTLLYFLKEGKVPEVSKPTRDPSLGGQFVLKLPGRGEVRFSAPQDLPGHTVPAYKDWREAFETADFVWYLFRADLIANGDVSETKLVEDHLGHLGDWFAALRARKAAPKVILVGVFADCDDTYNDDGDFEDRVRNSTPIRRGSVRLGQADIVTGSQATNDDATKLVERIARYLG